MILAVDGNSIINRAFYGIKLLTTADGRFTNAIYGLCASLESAKAELSPKAVIVCFDLPDKTFRHKMYPEYKAGRKGMPAELASQMQPAKELLDAMGCVNLELPGYEADDILGTISKLCEQTGEECVILTGDRDSLQLVSEKTTVRLVKTSMGRSESTHYTPSEILKEYGVTPPAMLDIKALMGDSSDNIPGVAGVGQKTAGELIQNFGSLDNVYAALNDPSSEIKESVRRKLSDGRDLAYLSKELGRICREVPLEINLADAANKQPNPTMLREILTDLEFFKLLQKWNLSAGRPAGGTAPTASAAAEPGSPPADAGASPSFAYAKAVGAASLLSAAGDAPVTLHFDPDLKTATADVKDMYCTAGISELKPLLENENIKKNIYDVKSALHLLAQHNITLAGDFFDPMIAAYLINPLQNSYSPERLFEQNGITAPTGSGGYIQSLDFLCEKLSLQIKEKDCTPLLYDIELPLARVLAEMESSGFRVDGEKLAAYGSELKSRMAELETEIYALAGESFNINSPKQLGNILFEKLNLPPTKKTKSGYSTDVDVLEKLALHHPIAEKILAYRKLAKLVGTYCDGLQKQLTPEGKIHTTFIQTETRTGRISSVEPNMQNIPIRTPEGSRLREFFVADEGKILIDADYSQIELRVLAALSGDENMISAFKNGVDIHTKTAAQVLGISENMVTPAARARAKAVNFGIVYGIGAYSLSGDIGVSVQEASDYIKSYFAAYPGVKTYLDSIIDGAVKNGYVTTYFGRRRPIPELASSNANLRKFGERAAKNTVIQGSAADIIKIAMCRISDALKAEKMESRLILQVHDELILHCPAAEEKAASALLKREMESAAGDAIPLLAEVNTGKTWLEAKG